MLYFKISNTATIGNKYKYSYKNNDQTYTEIKSLLDCDLLPNFYLKLGIILHPWKLKLLADFSRPKEIILNCYTVHSSTGREFGRLLKLEDDYWVMHLVNYHKVPNIEGSLLIDGKDGLIEFFNDIKL